MKTMMKTMKMKTREMKLTPRTHHHHNYLNLREEIFQATMKMAAGKRSKLRRKEEQRINQKIIN